MSLIDLNLIFKAVLSRLKLGASIKTIRSVLIDLDVLSSTNIDKDVMITHDHTSNTKALQLERWSTIKQLMGIECDSKRSDQVAVITTMLMFFSRDSQCYKLQNYNEEGSTILGVAQLHLVFLCRGETSQNVSWC